MVLEIKTSDIRKAIHEAYTTADQWEDEIKIFMDGIKSGDFIEFGDKSIGVQWRRGSNANDPRFIIFDYGDRRLRDDHFYVQHSRGLTDNELREIRDAMIRLGMVDKAEFDMEYCLNYDPKIYDSKIIKTSDIRKLVKEAMYKKLPGDGEDFPKFMGRRPKSIKARIERIHKRCNEYGLSSQKFHDDAWAAVGFYKRVIESLGYEVEIWVENGGYRDYDPQDHMPRSKQYEIRITADDGMVIEGYIKCMAAGSVQDPFDAYDTMMSLWPKPKRSYDSSDKSLPTVPDLMNNESIKKSELRRVIKESLKQKINEWDSDDPDEGPEDHAWTQSPSNEFNGIYDLTTNEVFEDENAPEIDVDGDEFGGKHKYVGFVALPDDYSIDSADDTWDSPGYWRCEINGYSIETDGVVYQTTVYDDGTALFDLAVSTGEQIDGFSEEQREIIEAYLNSEISTDYWNFE